MKFAPKHVVTMVACVCAAAVLAPVGVMAATGSLVNIVDPLLADRKVRVGSAGALHVESRAGVIGGDFNVLSSPTTTLSFVKLYETAAPNRIAVTEMSVATRGSDNGFTTQVELRGYVRTSGTNACGGAGWMVVRLRVVSVLTNTSEQLTFDGPPLILPGAATGHRVCFGFTITQLPSGVVVDVGTSGYTFR
jgi:hypothetical protein